MSTVRVGPAPTTVPDPPVNGMGIDDDKLMDDILEDSAGSMHASRSPSPARRGSTFRRASVHAAESVQEVITKLAQNTRVLHPQNSTFCRRWDFAMAVALIFTAIITPYEVAFLEVTLDWLFFANRLFDCVFAYDIRHNMRLAYFDKHDRIWQTDPDKVFFHYITGWFAVDIISTFPFDVVAYIWGGVDDNLKVLRLLKCLKLLKLLRMLKSERVFKRMEISMGITHANSDLLKKLIGFCMAIHWIACFWGIGPSLQDVQSELDLGLTPETWLYKGEYENLSSEDLYLICLEFSVQAMVMGESENSLPQNSFERLLSVVSMMIGGFVYALVVGSLCSLLQMQDPATKTFYEKSDLVTKFMDENELPVELGSRLREYFENCQQLFRNKLYVNVTESMSPALQREIAMHLHGPWLKNIKFFHASNPSEWHHFSAAIAVRLKPTAFPPNEDVWIQGDHSDYMVIVTKGMAAQAGPRSNSVLRGGMHAGEEMILTSATRRTLLKSLTYLNVSRLFRADLYTLLQDNPRTYPETIRMVRRARLKIGLRRCLAAIGAIFMLTMSKKERTEWHKKGGGKEQYRRDTLEFARKKARLREKRNAAKNRAVAVAHLAHGHIHHDKTMTVAAKLQRKMHKSAVSVLVGGVRREDDVSAPEQSWDDAMHAKQVTMLLELTNKETAQLLRQKVREVVQSDKPPYSSPIAKYRLVDQNQKFLDEEAIDAPFDKFGSGCRNNSSRGSMDSRSLDKILGAINELGSKLQQIDQRVRSVEATVQQAPQQAAGVILS